MKARPYSMIPALASRTYVYLFNYGGDEDDFTVDQTAFNLELEKHLPFGKAAAQNGIGATGTDLTISVVTTQRTITLASAPSPVFDAATIKHPVVLYQGEAIPYSDFDDTAPPSNVGLITLIAGTETKYPSVLPADYVVFYTDHLSGYLVSAEVGGVSLPIDSSSFNAVGHEEPVYRVIKRGDAEGTGSISVINDLTAHVFGAATVPVNDPGEELQKRIYGSDWTSGTAWDARNTLRPPTNPFGIAVLQHSGKLLDSAQGHVWSQLLCVYHCMLTDIGAPQNISNDATDPVLQAVDFLSRFPDKTDISVIRTTG